MNALNPRRLPARPLALPNILTYARIAAVPVVVGGLIWQSIFGGGLWLRWVALAVFIAAGVTDFFDGYFARIWGQQSSLGRMLDPIADKLLVATALMLLVGDGTIGSWSMIAALVILIREISVSGLREFLAGVKACRTMALLRPDRPDSNLLGADHLHLPCRVGRLREK